MGIAWTFVSTLTEGKNKTERVEKLKPEDVPAFEDPAVMSISICCSTISSKFGSSDNAGKVRRLITYCVGGGERERPSLDLKRFSVRHC
jgi:hypothetical protein